MAPRGAREGGREADEAISMLFQSKAEAKGHRPSKSPIIIASYVTANSAARPISTCHLCRGLDGLKSGFLIFYIQGLLLFSR